MSTELSNLSAISGHLYDIKNMLSKTNDILAEGSQKITTELNLARRDLDILVGLSTPEIEVLNRKKDLLKKEIDAYSGLFPDECVEYRDKLEKDLYELEQSIEKAKDRLYKKYNKEEKNEL